MFGPTSSETGQLALAHSAGVCTDMPHIRGLLQAKIGCEGIQERSVPLHARTMHLCLPGGSGACRAEPSWVLKRVSWPLSPFASRCWEQATESKHSPVWLPESCSRQLGAARLVKAGIHASITAGTCRERLTVLPLHNTGPGVSPLPALIIPPYARGTYCSATNTASRSTTLIAKH